MRVLLLLTCMTLTSQYILIPLLPLIAALALIESEIRTNRTI